MSHTVCPHTCKKGKHVPVCLIVCVRARVWVSDACACVCVFCVAPGEDPAYYAAVQRAQLPPAGAPREANGAGGNNNRAVSRPRTPSKDNMVRTSHTHTHTHTPVVYTSNPAVLRAALAACRCVRCARWREKGQCGCVRARVCVCVCVSHTGWCRRPLCSPQ